MNTKLKLNLDKIKGLNADVSPRSMVSRVSSNMLTDPEYLHTLDGDKTLPRISKNPKSKKTEDDLKHYENADLFKKDKVKKRIYRDKDGGCHKLTTEIFRFKLDERVSEEIKEIKKKVSFLKFMCDYSYPKIVKNRIKLIKPKSDKAENKPEKIVGCNYVSCNEINRTSNFFYSLKESLYNKANRELIMKQLNKTK
jgi:hypothetical protein